jgi:hypothetical protein
MLAQRSYGSCWRPNKEETGLTYPLPAHLIGDEWEVGRQRYGIVGSALHGQSGLAQHERLRVGRDVGTASKDARCCLERAHQGRHYDQLHMNSFPQGRHLLPSKRGAV